jgi:hypothetical protein
MLPLRDKQMDVIGGSRGVGRQIVEARIRSRARVPSARGDHDYANLSSAAPAGSPISEGYAPRGGVFIVSGRSLEAVAR